MASYFYHLIISVLLHFQSLSPKLNTNMAADNAPPFTYWSQWNNAPGAVSVQHLHKVFHAFPSQHPFLAHRAWTPGRGGGDRKRGRKGRLVEEWRNIISMRSRRGFVLCRLPSAPSTFLPSLFPPDLWDSELSVAALAMSYLLRA